MTQRENIAAFTEPGAEYPAFVSIGRDLKTGTYSVFVRQRGHGGNMIACIDGVSASDLRDLAEDVVDRVPRET